MLQGMLWEVSMKHQVGLQLPQIIPPPQVLEYSWQWDMVVIVLETFIDQLTMVHLSIM